VEEGRKAVLVLLVILGALAGVLQRFMRLDEGVELGAISRGLVVRMIPAGQAAEPALDRLEAGARRDLQRLIMTNEAVDLHLKTPRSSGVRG
jgi:hypothetical protein